MQMLEHEALLHDGTDCLVENVTPIVLACVEAKRPVFVTLTEERLWALRNAVDGREDRSVEWHETETWFPHPARRLRALAERLSMPEVAVRRPLYVLEQPSPTGTAGIAPEWERLDAAMDVILSGLCARVICTYDTAVLDPDRVARVGLCHRTGTVSRLSGTYAGGEECLRSLATELSRVPNHARSLEAPDPAAGRQLARDAARSASLDPLRSDDFALAASEVVTNSLVHGRRPVSCHWWLDEHLLSYQVDDGGRGVLDPLAGYRSPPAGANQGRGLWLARQLVDSIEFDSSRGVSSVRLSVCV
ncbi:MAG: ATP-binding protein [Acidimicrobiales bacterium]